MRCDALARRQVEARCGRNGRYCTLAPLVHSLRLV